MHSDPDSDDAGLAGTVKIEPRNSAEDAPDDASGLPVPDLQNAQAVGRSRSEREAIRARDPYLFAEVSKAMFERDPCRINFGNNTDEYDSEAGTVIPYLSSCASEEDVIAVLQHEFLSWFGLSIAGKRERHIELARDIWRIWQLRSSNPLSKERPVDETG